MVENVIVGGTTVVTGALLIYTIDGVRLLLKYGEPSWSYIAGVGQRGKTFEKDDDPKPRQRHYALMLLTILTSFVLGALLILFLWGIGEVVTSALSLVN